MPAPSASASASRQDYSHRVEDFPALEAERAKTLTLPDSTSPFLARPIGEILVRTGALVPANLDRALKLQTATDGTRLGTILVSEQLVSEDALASGLALQQGVLRVRPLPKHIDMELLDRLGADLCIRHGILPWRIAGPVTVVATSRPHRFEDIRPLLEDTYGTVRMAIADETDIVSAILELRADWMVNRAEARPPRNFSVRRFHPVAIAAGGLALPLGVAAVAIPYPGIAQMMLTAWVVGMLALVSILRVAAALASFGQPPQIVLPETDPNLTPMISLLVPLLKEADISGHLIDRLSELDYPADRLDICLIVEADDQETDAALERRGLPPEFRQIIVPQGSLRTKPRALNYALDFCKGDIIGIYDAEDAPETDQLRRVVARFAAAPRQTVCLQGRLAFYNAGQNWLSRCFAIDYAAWFGVILPGLAKLGFAIPLGGTGLFFRRAALDALGRWDAHNVTEDADLGIRIARRGWKAEMIDTTTREEANCHPGAWVRQRGRWLKGYALTYAVHMRNPIRLWRDLGPGQFMGFQILFLGTLSLFLMAPLLWSFWLIPLGLPHPVADALPRAAMASMVALFILSELANMVIAAVGVWKNGDRWLLPWIPSTIFYFPMAAFASYRALADLIMRPFFWDKTAHGLSLPEIKRLSQKPRHSDEDDSRKRSRYGT